MSSTPRNQILHFESGINLEQASAESSSQKFLQTNYFQPGSLILTTSTEGENCDPQNDSAIVKSSHDSLSTKPSTLAMPNIEKKEEIVTRKKEKNKPRVKISNPRKTGLEEDDNEESRVTTGCFIPSHNSSAATSTDKMVKSSERKRNMSMPSTAAQLEIDQNGPDPSRVPPQDIPRKKRRVYFADDKNQKLVMIKFIENEEDQSGVETEITNNEEIEKLHLSQINNALTLSDDGSTPTASTSFAFPATQPQIPANFQILGNVDVQDAINPTANSTQNQEKLNLALSETPKDLPNAIYRLRESALNLQKLILNRKRTKKSVLTVVPSSTSSPAAKVSKSNVLLTTRPVSNMPLQTTPSSFSKGFKRAPHPFRQSTMHGNRQRYTDGQICFFFLRGTCKFGIRCFNKHYLPRDRRPTKYDRVSDRANRTLSPRSYEESRKSHAYHKN